MPGFGFGSHARARRSPGGSTPPPPSLTPTAMQSSVTDGSATFTFAAPVPVGQYADGTYFKIGGSTISTSPASVLSSGLFDNGNPYTDRWINGLEVDPGSEGGTGLNPSLTPQGFDTVVFDTLTTTAPTEFAYLDSRNQAPEKTAIPLSGNTTLVKAVSVPSPIQAKGRDRVNDMKYLTTLAAVPPVGSFRRWSGDPDKVPWFTTADLDLSVLLSLAQPGGSVLPTMAYMRAHLGPFQTTHNFQLSARGIAANNQQSGYGGDIARDVVEAMLFTMTAGVSPADRLEIAIKLVQAGLDFANAAERGRRWSGATYSYGGAHQWMKILIVYAARLLRNASNTTARAIIDKWADANQQKVWADDLMLFSLTRERIEALGTGDLTDRMWPIQYPDWSENTVEWTSKPSGTASGLSFEHSYRTINGYPMMTSALIARLIGGQSLWGNTQFFDYMDRFHNLWVARGSPTDSYFGAYPRAMVQTYYTANSPTHTGVGAPALVRREARGRFAWIEASENFDLAFQPAAADLTVTVDGSGVSLASVATTCNGTRSTASPSVNQTEPVITVASATGIRVGQRVVCASLPSDTQVRSVSGTTIGITTHVPATFSGQAVTFHNVLAYGRSLVAVLPVPLTSEAQPVTIGYTEPGAGFVRNLRGTGIGTLATSAATNRTGQLPSPATVKDFAYSGLTAASRQYSGTSQPSSFVLRRFRMSLRFMLKAAMVANENLVASSTAATSNFRLYASTASDLRVLFAGRSMRLPGALTGVPINTPLTLHLFFDFTALSIGTVNKAALVWSGGGNSNLSTTGSTGTVDGTFSADIATVFSLGMFTHASGSGGNPFHGGISELIVGWGDENLPLPADLTGAAFAHNADWGGNGQNVWGQSQRYYAGSIAEWNGGVLNRGSGGAVALVPKRADEEGNLTTEYALP